MPTSSHRNSSPRTPMKGAGQSSGQVQSLSRGLTLLEYIADAHGSISLTDLAQRAGLANSTTHRLLSTLAQHGFVRQLGEQGLWTMGARAFTVGASFLDSRNLLAMVHPHLRDLMERSGETVNLAVVDHATFDAIIIDQVQCNQLMRMSASIGGTLPMHASGAGKALLSTLKDDYLTRLLHRKGMHAYTPHTLTAPQPLKNDLAAIRKRGFSFDDEEHALGLRCVAAYLFNEYHEPFAALSISGPGSRITDDRVVELGALVINASRELTHQWGGSAPGPTDYYRV